MTWNWSNVLLRNFKLTEPQLAHVAQFLLAHALLDRWLIYLVALAEFRKEGPRLSILTERDAWERRLNELIKTASKGTFGAHMKAAQDLGLVADDVAKVCTEVNRGRNSFLHWMPQRFETPRYEGLEITTDAGLERCIRDVDTAIRAMAGDGEESTDQSGGC